MQQPQTTTEPIAVERTRASRLVGLVSVALAAALLAACAAVPPQSVTDPLGLDSQQLALQFVAPTTAAAADLGAQAVGGEAAAAFQFDDWDIDSPVRPGTLTNDVTIKSASLSPATEADAPAEITLSDPVLTVRVWQGAATFEEAADADRVEHVLEATAAITLVRDGTCVISGGGTCRYAYDGDSAALGVIKLSGSSLSSLFNIATAEPTPNSGSVSLTVQGSPDDLEGRSLTLTLGAAEGTIGF